MSRYQKTLHLKRAAVLLRLGGAPFWNIAAKLRRKETCIRRWLSNEGFHIGRGLNAGYIYGPCGHARLQIPLEQLAPFKRTEWVADRWIGISS